MQFILCNSALLAHETLFLTKKHYFAQSFQKSAQIATNLKHHNKIVFISKSNLSGGCCLRVCATSHKTTSQLRPGPICQRPTCVKMLQDTKSSGTVRLQVFLKNGKITQQFLSWRYNILLLLLYTDRSLIFGR